MIEKRIKKLDDLEDDFTIEFRRKFDLFYKVYNHNTTSLNLIRQQIVKHFNIYKFNKEKIFDLSDWLLIYLKDFCKYLSGNDIDMFLEMLHEIINQYLYILEQEEEYESCHNLKYIHDLLQDFVNIDLT